MNDPISEDGVAEKLRCAREKMGILADQKP